MLSGLFQDHQPIAGSHSSHQDNHHLTQRHADEPHGCAFDNPYFRDEQLALASGQASNNQSYLLNRHESNSTNQRQESGSTAVNRQSTAGLLATSQLIGRQGYQEQPGSEQLHFIEHHISNLHNKQVTSSVRELSILGKFYSSSPQ